MKRNGVTSKIVGIALVCLMLGSILGGLLGTLNTSVNAAPLTYDKDTILCNHDFDFTNTLSEEEIQNIFESRNSFFKDYIDPTTSKRASWVVADRAQYYQISSRVLLAKMQHESSSVWAYKDMNEHIYNEAGIDMGTRADWVLFYGWSDTTIYPQYKGFYNQVDNAAKSLSEWFADPSSKGWEVGKPHAVSDGTVTPTNKVTCALYIYTPWIGDTEPPSGNKLLYQVWKMMFGDTGVCSRTWYVDDDLADYPGADFTKIQDAVDAASPSDTIIVYPGTYTENMDVNKDHLTIQSQNGAEATIIEAANPDDHVFEVTADYVNITGFTVVNGGILLETSSNNLIAENCIFGADGGLGIGLSNSSNNSISDNEIMVPAMTGYSIGIGLYNSSSNKVSRNRVMLFTMYPYVLVGSDISLENSSSNNIYLNDLSSVMSFNSTNIWNSPEEITYTYNGNTYTNYLGNYWSDYGIYLPAVGHNDPDDQWEDETLAYDENKNTYARVYLSGGRDSSWLELLVPAGKLTQGIRFWGSGGPLEVDIYYGGNWYCLRDWAWGISSAPANE